MTGAAVARASRTSTPEPERFVPGVVLGQRYRIAGRIGRGGMGEVYRAYDLILEQEVALKFLPAAGSSPAALDRFRNEVRLARQVSHPNVCRVYDIGEIEGAAFLSMEYVDGEDLASLLRRIGRVPADKALDIARRLCAGLAAAHEKGVLHRDLKPANIMIDGRGEVLITDFGLAALAGSVDEATARQGTPAYQAPEQLAGREVTIKSDLYAAGLVLYEMFTGRRAFEARSLEELSRIQRESTPAGISSIARDVDPAVDRAILRCLAPDPRHRPASAKAFAASLPGGDPLAAALAAGETPSPEMVAQAGERQGMRPAQAIGLLAVTLAGLVAVAAIASATGFPAKTPFENSPEALTTMAEQLISRLGYTQKPANTAFGFEASADYIEYAQRHYAPDRILAQLRAARPAPISFWYRQSPQAMNPRNVTLVSPDNPGFSVPGMIRLSLDMEGRLLAFEALPTERSSVSARGAAPPDWKPLFDAAKLNPEGYQPAVSDWTPAMAFDAAAAWTGVWPDAPEVPIRIEAAAWRGQPVSFRIVQPWTRAAVNGAGDSTFQVVWTLVPYFVLLPAGILLAYRNVRLKRGDRAGAIRLAIAAFAVSMTGELMWMHYFWSFEQPWRMWTVASWIFGQCLFMGIAYLAIEPYVRRHSPQFLISWSRLLQNGPRDGLVGAHILTGCAAAVVVDSLNLIAGAARVSRAHRFDGLIDLHTGFYGARQFLGQALLGGWSNLFLAMVLIFLFFLMRLALRRDWLAAAAAGLVFAAASAPQWSAPVVDIPCFVAMFCIFLFLVLRCGLLGLATTWVAGFWLDSLTPLTIDPSRWYTGYSVSALLLVAALAVWAFRTALDGRKLLRDESLG
jgi:predicted Ser/Thr protein kinase